MLEAMSVARRLALHKLSHASLYGVIPLCMIMGLGKQRRKTTPALHKLSYASLYGVIPLCMIMEVRKHTSPMRRRDCVL